MVENKIEEKSIIRSVRSLLTEGFYVPKYQRGYRWTKKQVNDLLNDIDRFDRSNDEGKNSWYCLQPLVVKKQEDGQYCLIDGQQRLTTIKLILTYLNTRFPDDEKEEIFAIKYETREKYGDWLNIIDDKTNAEKCIDFSHIFDSYQSIQKWMIEQKKNSNFKISNFKEKLLHSCMFIWYDIEQNGQNNDKEEDIFIRLNDGKIPLTNSELIKALFLNSSNFAKDKNEEEIKLRQLEISTQWDVIEQDLSDNELWYFINGKENMLRPRIEYLFNVIAQKPAENKEDADFTFRYFQSKFEDNEQKQDDNKVEFIKKEWENILNTYLILKEWFGDKHYYHLIGYLLCTNYKIGDLLKEYQDNDKDVFRNELVGKIKNGINWNGNDSLKYGDGRVRKILLLHNVITMQQQQNETARFPFSYYIELEKYDIEHIHPQTPKLPSAELRKDWLNGRKIHIENEELMNKVNAFSDFVNDESFRVINHEIEEYFASGIDENTVDDLSNLALLDAHTNRSYHNDFFPGKREKILHEDIEGTFIPVCTKKIFQKSYTATPKNMTFWEEDDRTAYFEDIKQKLSEYLK